MNFEERLKHDFIKADASIPAGRLALENTIERAKRLSVTRFATVAIASVVVLAGGLLAADAIDDRGAGTVGPSGSEESVNPAPTDDTDDPTPPGDADAPGREGLDALPECPEAMECPVSPEDAPDGRYANEPTTPDISQNGFVPPPGTKNGACSAAQDFSRIVPVGDQSLVLSPAAGAMRTRIIAAAWACDYNRLEELAWGGADGKGFVFGRGANEPRVPEKRNGPASYWRRAEELGQEEMAILVAVLEQEPAVVPSGDLPDRYVWPAETSAGFGGRWQVEIDDSGDWLIFAKY